MLIDKLKKRTGNICFMPYDLIDQNACLEDVPKMTKGYKKIKDTITFFIDENLSDFLTGVNLETKQLSKMPYDNVFLQFKTLGLWFTESPVVVASPTMNPSNTYTLLCTFLQSSDVLPKIPKGATGYLPNGFYLSFELDKPGFIMEPFGKIENITDDEVEKMAISMAFAVKQFTDILKCKNIKTTKIIPKKSKKTKKYNRERPLSMYHILQIEDKNSAKGTGKETEYGWSNRVHLCRGHIKTYTAEKPLFGHYVGNVWCPPHARGNKKLGIINKDYKI